MRLSVITDPNLFVPDAGDASDAPRNGNDDGSSGALVALHQRARA